MVQELDHIALIVSSEDSLRFYEKLGFRETERFERSYDIVVFMTCGNITLEIFVDPNHPERVNSPEAKGLDDTDLRVPHMGWDIVDFKQDCPLLRNLQGQQRYYFVHSYHAKCDYQEKWFFLRH